MPINVCGSTFIYTAKKFDTYSSVQNPFLRTNFIESKNEGDIDIKKTKLKLKTHLGQSIPSKLLQNLTLVMRPRIQVLQRTMPMFIYIMKILMIFVLLT